ncbi:peroxiredoxin-like family protein [Marivirga salinae]|uniref:Peroxiredoxin-like family protein n=1 Tax=Marivirga salinarum TaxID=3059078 RepID=A0AA49GBZ2_9BACT|nr:peroxiredoxin-like family protein [Marivirga sp. BDSF4-3]WKK78535.2 peroxiredoxin-like family protein [Marivirga sp. BDSF4-3]
MSLHNTALAPLFEKKDIFGRQINLEDYKDKKLLLGFFRHAGCPFCNLRVHALTKVHEKLKAKGLEMIFFFESKESVLLRSSFHQEVSPIPLISDPEKEIYGKYGLEENSSKSTKSIITNFVQQAIKAKLKGIPVHMMRDGESINTIPAEFLIDKGFRLKKLHYSKSLTDRLDLDLIEQFADDSSIFDDKDQNAA